MPRTTYGKTPSKHRIVLDVNSETRERFKRFCEENGWTQAEAMRQMMQAYEEDRLVLMPRVVMEALWQHLTEPAIRAARNTARLEAIMYLKEEGFITG